MKEKLAPRARFELATLRLTAVNLISSQVAGAELNRGKSASSDQTGLARFSFSFLLLFAFCSFSRRSYDTYMTLAPLPCKQAAWAKVRSDLCRDGALSSRLSSNSATRNTLGAVAVRKSIRKFSFRTVLLEAKF